MTAMTMTEHAIEQIQEDFKNDKGPFGDVTFPEEELIEEVKPQNEYEKAMLLTAFCTLDYNRDARRLKNNLVELYEHTPMNFAPKTLTSPLTNHNVADFKEIFRNIKFRYKNRDAEGLWHNYEIIANQYGTVQQLLEDVDYDAVKLVERLEQDNFKYLKGVKLAPFYARVIHDEVHELDRIWQVDIPVDTHIRTLTHKLTGDETMTDDEIREFWRYQGEENGVERHLVDGALWQIGNNWDEWGEDYFNEVTS